MMREELRVGMSVMMNPAVTLSGSQKFPGEWIVEKIMPVNIKLHRADNPHARLRTYADALMPWDPEVAQNPIAHSAFLTRTEFFDAGNLVRCIGMVGLYVVMKDDGGDRVNIVKMGGEGGRYWRVSPSKLVVQTPADLREALLGREANHG